MSHELIHTTLIGIHGQPVRVDAAGILRAMGLRCELHPKDACAVRYADLEAATVFAEANREHHGHVVFGPMETEIGPVNLIDLRPSIRSMGSSPTDPALPDDIDGSDGNAP